MEEKIPSPFGEEVSNVQASENNKQESDQQDGTAKQVAEEKDVNSQTAESQPLDGNKREIDIFEILSISWKKFKENWKFLVILALIYFGIRIAEGVLQKSFQANSIEAIIASILIAFFNVLIAIGMIQVFLKISRGEQVNYGEIFGGTKYFWKFIGASILYILIILAGYLLLIIPGIIWQYKYSMFSYLLIDKDMSPMEAIRESGRLMDGNKWKLFFLQLLMIPIIILGVIFFGIGILVAIPVVTLMSVFFYRMVIGEGIESDITTEKISKKVKWLIAFVLIIPSFSILVFLYKMIVSLLFTGTNV